MWASSTGYMLGAEYAANSVGPAFDPEELLAAGCDVPAAQAMAGDVRLAYEEIVRGREHATVG